MIGLFGVGIWLYAAFCGYVLFRIWQKGQVEARQEIFDQLTWHVGVAFVVGLIALFIGWRLAMRIPELMIIGTKTSRGRSSGDPKSG